MTDLQKCTRCKCIKKMELFKIRNNTGIRYKTCIKCGERFKCPSCDYKCSRQSDLKKHIKQVHDKIRDFECPSCDFKCSQQSDLNKHIKQVHDKIRDFECPHPSCDYKCSTQSTLNIHIKMFHDKIKDFECPSCDFKCSTQGHLKRHIKMVHDKIRDFECPSCDYKCSTQSTLNQHIKICTGERNISSGELQVINSLKDLGFVEGEDYYFNQTFSELTQWSGRNLRPDFRFIEHKIIIEYDGKQHFEPVPFGGISEEKAQKAFDETKVNDKLKDDFCEEYGYRMIRISYKDFTKVLGVLTTELYDIIDWTG